MLGQDLLVCEPGPTPSAPQQESYGSFVTCRGGKLGAGRIESFVFSGKDQDQVGIITGI